MDSWQIKQKLEKADSCFTLNATAMASSEKAGWQTFVKSVYLPRKTNYSGQYQGMAERH
jgi:hypothetical protein